MKRRVWLVAGAIGLVAVGLAAWPLPEASAPSYEPHALGPTDARSVYWVGHSLMAFRDPHDEGARNVMETVGALAESRGLRYRGFDHTHWGSPLSLAYRGRPHGHEREEPELAARTNELRTHGDEYDTMVLTDTVPIAGARKYEHTSYYATRFACELLARRPDARIYLYESWVSFQAAWDEANVGSPAAWRWLERLEDERRGYTEVAREVSAGRIVEPGPFGRLSRWFDDPAPCVLEAPVFVVPVASTFVRLGQRLPVEEWRVEGRPLTLTDFFQNPYVEWPSDWPRDDVDEATARARMRTLPRRRTDEPVDDTHPSQLGTYFAALVHFAVLYRQSPEGLPALTSGLDDTTRVGLQRLVWEQVSSDPRTGVRSD